MKVMVVGASGRVGQKLIEILAQQGHTVHAATRTPAKLTASTKIIPTFLDLHWQQSKIESALKGMEVVYFVAGSRSQDLLQTDLNGAVKVMAAAKVVKIKRFIHLSTIYSLIPAKWPQNMQDYYIAKYFSDTWLIKDSQLAYTILQPGPLTEQIGSGQVTLNITTAKANSIDNVAAVLAEIIDKSQTYYQVISMADGVEPVREAIQKLNRG